MWKQTHSARSRTSSGTIHDQCRKKMYRGAGSANTASRRSDLVDTKVHSPGSSARRSSNARRVPTLVPATKYRGASGGAPVGGDATEGPHGGARPSGPGNHT